LRIFRKRSGPACQWPTSAHGHVSRPTHARERSGGVVTVRHLTPARSVARQVPSTRCACVHRPCALISCYRGPKEKHPSTSTPPHASSLFAPLPLIAFLDREDLPGASPLRPTPGLVFTFLSTTEPWSTSPTSPFSPTSTTSTPRRRTPPPDRHRRHEPATVSLPPSFAPNWDPRRPGLLPGHFPSDQRLPAGPIRPVSRRRRGNSALPCFFGHGPKCRAGPLGRAGLAMLWVEPGCTVFFIIIY
jgi:hypothetical protein